MHLQLLILLSELLELVSQILLHAHSAAVIWDNMQDIFQFCAHHLVICLCRHDLQQTLNLFQLDMDLLHFMLLQQCLQMTSLPLKYT